MTSEQSSSNPALEAATKELTDIFSNPANPHHSGYHRNERTVMEYVESLYTKATPGAAPVSLDQGISVTGRKEDQSVPPAELLSPEQRQGQIEHDLVVQRTFGDECDTVLRNSSFALQYLFTREEYDGLRAKLSPKFAALGPAADVALGRFLDTIWRLSQNTQQGG